MSSTSENGIADVRADDLSLVSHAKLMELIDNSEPGSELHKRSLREQARRVHGNGDGPDVQPLLGTEEPEPMKWRVSDFVPEDHLTMLVGDGGTGKSILALYLSLRVCTGHPFLGMGTRKGRVLYVDHELDRDEQLRRVHRISRGMGLDAGDTALRDRFLYCRPPKPSRQ
jgi:hypothetical protein